MNSSPWKMLSQRIFPLLFSELDLQKVNRGQNDLKITLNFCNLN